MNSYNNKSEGVFKALPAYLMEGKDIVRINVALGKWVLDENNKEGTIAYLFKGDPGGNIGMACQRICG